MEEALEAVDHEMFEMKALELALREAQEDQTSSFHWDNSTCFSAPSVAPKGSTSRRRSPVVRGTRNVGKANERKRSAHVDFDDAIAAVPSSPNELVAKQEDSAVAYTGESYLDKLPTEVLHKILFLLEDVKFRIDAEFLDARVALPEEARKVSKSMLSFLLTCKRIWTACYKRGGLPSCRPLFCILTFAKRGDHERLHEMLQVIGEPARRTELLNEALLLCTSTSASTAMTAEVLLKAGAQASTSGPSGAPAHFAARRGHAALLALLEAHGGEEVKKARCPLGFSVSQWAENAGNFEFAAKLRAENWD